ncbi:MAG: hypothetical protein HYS41_03015 [Candidatus Omnitrophica bacterium]|nr:hypothetical protein [Candidatus Omnitrophota bacterium]
MKNKFWVLVFLVLFGWAALSFAQETVWLDDAVAPGGATEGSWLWEDSAEASGGKAHAHPSAKGQQSHGIGLAPALLPANGMISQTVWLDPQDPPRGIMLKVKTETGEEAGVYWEGEEEVFVPADEEEVFYYGLLPELGKWVTLEVLAEDLGLEDEKIAQITFVTFDGRVLWDKTVLTEAPPAEEVEFFPDLSPPVPQEEAPLPGNIE